MTSKKYKSHIYKNSFGKGSDQKSIKEGQIVSLGNMDKAVKLHKILNRIGKRKLKPLRSIINGFWNAQDICINP